MRSSMKYAVPFLIFAVLNGFLYAAASPKQATQSNASKTNETGNMAAQLSNMKGPGTDPAVFNDNSLIYTPVPTATPDFTIKTPDIEAWRKLADTRSLLNLTEKDLINYNKTFRADFMKALNGMGQVVSSIYTDALLDKRDEVETAWEKSMEPAEHSLALAEEWNNEFNEDYKQMGKNQKRTADLLRKFSNKIQNAAEVKEKMGQNDRDMYFVKKDIDSFGELFNNYTAKYEAMIKTKEDKVNKLLNDHYELYKP
jgi:hypothetical protein